MRFVGFRSSLWRNYVSTHIPSTCGSILTHDGAGGVGVFNNAFIDSLFDLVEQTREMQDETFNYSVIKLIVSSLFFPLS